MAEKKDWQKLFNNAAEGIILKPKNGLDYLIDTYVQKSDVTIMGDNHLTSVSKYKDFLSEKNLEKFSKAGITQIHIEIPDRVDNLRQELADGKMTKEEFVQGMAKQVSLTAVKDPVPIFKDLANAIVNAKKNGIELHFNQVDFTPEQSKEMKEFLKQNSEGLQNKYIAQTNEIDTFLKEAGVSDIKRDRFIDKLMQTDKRFEEISLKGIDAKAFRDELTAPQMLTLNHKLDVMRGTLQDYDNKELEFNNNMLLKFRVGADGELANRVAASIEHGGKALVMHGVLHGATDKADVDDLLAAKGLKVSRVNLTYSEFDQDYNQAMTSQKIMKDPSDVYYSPKKDSVELMDMNKNGLIDAGPTPAKQVFPHH